MGAPGQRNAAPARVLATPRMAAGAAAATGETQGQLPPAAPPQTLQEAPATHATAPGAGRPPPAGPGTQPTRAPAPPRATRASGATATTAPPAAGAAPRPHQGGLAAAIAEFAEAYEDATVRAQLAVQKGIRGDPTKMKQFAKKAVDQAAPVVFAMMTTGTPFISVLHNARVYSSMLGKARRYEGKVIASIGDRTPTKRPDQVLLKDKPWTETTKRLPVGSLIDMAAHHGANRENPSLWKPPTGGEREDVAAPIMLMIPHALVSWIVGGPRTCGDLHEQLVKLTTKAGSTVTAEDIRVGINFCRLGGTEDRTNAGDSLLAFDPPGASSPEPEFDRWVDFQLDKTLGPLTRAAGRSACATSTAGNQGGLTAAPAGSTDAGAGNAMNIMLQYLVAMSARGTAQAGGAPVTKQ